MLKVYPILCRAGKMDNYAYLLLDEATGVSAVIDPSEAAPIIKKCAELGVKPDYILNTHHHFDHTDANEELKKLYGAKVVANINDAARIPGFDIGVEPGGTFALGESIAEIIDVSAHTQGHILWYFPKDKVVFTGDTLFNLCVGGLFEGSVEEMYAALQKIKQLPDDVLFYPGHEYTMPSVPMALHLLPDSPVLPQYIQNARQRLAQNLPVAPVALGIEKQCNPYLHADSLAELQQIF